MPDSKGREGSAQASERKEPLDDRLSEATNAETLSELEEKQKLGDSSKNTEREVPAPDAEPAEPDKAGPM